MKKTFHGLRLGLTIAGAVAAAFAGAGCEIDGTVNPRSIELPAGPPPYTPPPPAPRDRRVVILHTNDEHSHLLGFGPETEYPYLPVFTGGGGALVGVDADATATQIAASLAAQRDDQTTGGFVRRQHLVNQIRAESDDPVLLLSAGDFTMGTLLHAAGNRASPDLVLMSLLGYDFVTLGNHEFDFGPDYFAATVVAGQNLNFGGAVSVLASNLKLGDLPPVAVANSGTSVRALVGDGDSGAAIMPWATRILPNGLKIGFLGLLGYEAQLETVQTGLLTFSVPSTGAACTRATAADDCAAGEACKLGHCVHPLDAAGHFAALVADAQATVNLLRDGEDVDVVVALTHLGAHEDTLLAQSTAGIDVIIGGHSHTELAPTVVTSQLRGRTIIVQAGSYGRLLGQLTVVVAPDGAVSYDPATSALHDVDHQLDPEIFAGTDLAASPAPVLSPALKQAITTTVSVVGPAMAGIDSALHPLRLALGGGATPIPSLWSPLVASDHPVLGPDGSVDSNLIHLVTDAELTMVRGGACVSDPYVIAVQANGVIRDDLRFGAAHPQFPPAADPAPEMASVADVFRVLPLAASPFEDAGLAAPGLPVVLFRLNLVQLMAGLDIGVTRGLESDAFFLSYSGMRVTYDASLPPFNASAVATDPGGRVTKIELGSDAQIQSSPHVLYDRSRGGGFLARFQDAGGAPVNPGTTTIAVITNLYLAGFLDAFGIVPVLDASGEPTTGATASERLQRIVMCQTRPTANCDGTSTPRSYVPCNLASGPPPQSPPWVAPELKEWQALLTYLTVVKGGQLAAGEYAGAQPAFRRVVPVQP